MLHTDVMQLPVASKGYKYAITFLDDHSRYYILYLFSKKSDVSDLVRQAISYASCQSVNPAVLFVVIVEPNT